MQAPQACGLADTNRVFAGMVGSGSMLFLVFVNGFTLNNVALKPQKNESNLAVNVLRRYWGDKTRLSASRWLGQECLIWHRPTRLTGTTARCMVTVKQGGL
jgi:hypothetical protein